MTRHPLEIFKYCPKCGSEFFEEHNFKSKHCSNCGFTYYQNPSSSTAAFILNSKEELLDNEETAEEGMIREIKEETGLDISKVEYLFSIPNIYRYSGMDIHTLDMFFLCHTEAEIVKAADDVSECNWVPLQEVYVERFGLRSIREAVHRFLLRKC